MTDQNQEARDLADKLDGLCTPEWSWKYLGDAAKLLRALSTEVHPTEPKLPESLEVVAWAYYDGERENFPSGPHATLLRSTALSFERHPHYRNETALVRLSDAESALKARDAEIESAKITALNQAHEIVWRFAKKQAKANDRGVVMLAADEIRAAIDQARAEGGEKEHG